MKRVRRITRQKIRALERSLRRLRSHLTAARALFILEAIIFCGALAFALTGSRAALVDRLGSRADIWVMTSALVALGLLHVLVNRRVAPILDRRFSPETYDERRILFDLGQAARAVTTIDELYKLVVSKIGEALHTANISIFVRDDETGDYVCRISSLPETARETLHGVEPRQGGLALAHDAFIVRRLRHLSAPLGIEPQDFEAWERSLDAAPSSFREARRRENETLRQIESRLLQQITMRDQLIGIISLGPLPGNRSFSAGDKQLLISIASQMALVIEHARLVERIVEEERLRRELALATEVQQRLFPASPPASESVDLAGFCQPARGVGGDYYDFLPLDNGQIGVAVADVAGKGIAAALLMSTVQASLRSQAMARSEALVADGSLANLVRAMNRLLCRSTGASSYVTFFYAQFDELRRRLTYVNAGHNPPLLVRAGRAVAHTSPKEHAPLSGRKSCAPAESALAICGNVETGAATALWEEDPEESLAEDNTATLPRKLTMGGPILGVFEGCYYEQETIQMQSGDLLFAYTDGLTEALNPEGEEFGEARLQGILVSSAHLPADEVRRHIVERVREWSAGAPQHDDLTFVVMEVR